MPVSRVDKKKSEYPELSRAFWVLRVCCNPADLYEHCTDGFNFIQGNTVFFFVKLKLKGKS